MRKNLLKLKQQVEKNNNVITVEEIENTLGMQTYVKNLGNFKRIWVFEDTKEKELIHLTIQFGPHTDTVEVLNYDIFSL